MNLARPEEIKDYLKKWRINLTRIQAVLHDAARQQITKERVKVWLLELQDLAYDIDDVLDDKATEVIRRKFNQKSHASFSTNKVLKIIPTSCTNFPLSNIKYGRELSSKLDKIISKLKSLWSNKITGFRSV
ncbi:putative disease resistance RPP13-like protein 1 [Tanacetum coccineum]